MAYLNRGIIRPLVVVGIVAAIGVSLGVALIRTSPKTVISDLDLVYKATRGTFISEVTEPGDLDSSSNIVIKCKIKNRGRAGTPIKEIVPEGSFVKKGELIAQFDDSALQDELIAQKIQVANDKASKIQAESSLRAAKQVLEEFENGTFEKEKAKIEAEVAFAQENLERAEDYLRFSDLLNSKGYVTDSQRDADQFAVVKAKKELALAQQNLDVYTRFTNKRMVQEYNSEIKKQEAYLEAAKFTLLLSQQREKEIDEQVANCRVVAPQDGMVIYANEGRRDNSSIVIEEGTMIRDGQELVKLPNPKKMEVVTQVNDSKINRVNKGDLATIFLDSDPETPIPGRVREVSSFPLPRRWFQAPINYEVFVEITDVTENVRPGLRAKVKIVVDSIDDVLQIPSSAVIRDVEDYFVIVKRKTDWEVRKVEIGANNDKFVVVTKGLQEGEPVLISPEKYRDNSDVKEKLEKLKS